MYHILAPKCHGQDSARLREYHPLVLPAADARADPLGLVERPAPVLAAIGRVEEQVDLAGAGGGLDPVKAAQQVAGARLHAEAVEGRLAQCLLSALAEV